ncbi:hypothetical protein BC834DRAFT_622759 [Gloeopeniophorella convolvens]|nr:hypothetical protein BC834DRAFT_622759 [Gloeopeniophorella convolvens]
MLVAVGGPHTLLQLGRTPYASKNPQFSAFTMAWFMTFRLATFATAILFSFLVMALSAALIALTAPVYYQFSGFSLFTSLFTMLILIPMFVVDVLRKQTFVSYVITEVVASSVLWIFWLSSAAYAASFFPEGSNCDFGFDDRFSAECHEIQAITAFGFLTWLPLMAYTGVLLWYTVRAHMAGHKVWTTSARDGVIFLSSAKSAEEPASHALDAFAKDVETPPQQIPVGL